MATTAAARKVQENPGVRSFWSRDAHYRALAQAKSPIWPIGQEHVDSLICAPYFGCMYVHKLSAVLFSLGARHIGMESS